MEGSEVKPARVAPPKPMPYLPQRPPIEPLTQHASSDGPPPTKLGKKPPPSVPPPPPPRVDLGETAVDVGSSIKEQSNFDLAQKGSPKPNPKGRPEISIVSTKPMDSSEVIPPPAVPAQPAPVFEEPLPKAPQRRKPKGREPPPRPKTRPVSELTLESDELDMGSVISDKKINSHKEDVSKADGSRLSNTPAFPRQKVKNDKPEINDVLRTDEHTHDSGNVNEKSELHPRDLCEIGEEDQQINKVADKSTAIKAKPRERESRSSSDVDEAKEKCLDGTGIPVVEAVVAGKKTKPTVIVAKPPKKTTSSQGPEEKDGIEEHKGEKPIPVSTQERKPPPPAKKPKPALKPKPSSVVEPAVTESAEDKKLDSTVAPKPKAKPTVILPAKPSKTTDVPKTGGESTEEKEVNGVQKKAPRPTVILAAKPSKATETPTPGSESVREKDETVAQVKTSPGPTVVLPSKPSKSADAPRDSDKETSRSVEDGQTSSKVASAEPGEMQDQSAAPQPVKTKRVPTVIRAPRPQGQETGVERKAPKRPQRGPSIRRSAPPRPDSAPPAKNEDQSELAAGAQKEEAKPDASALLSDKVQTKSRPQRPVTMPGVKENESVLDKRKLHESESSLGTEKNITRKGSKKGPPPPRPAAADSVRGEVEPTSEIRDEVHSSDEKSNEKHRPAPRGAPSSKLAGGKTSVSSDAQKTQDHKPKEKSKSPRPSSRTLDSTHPKDLHDEPEEAHVEVKTKPARPAPAAPKADAASRNAAEIRTVAESSADDHVNNICTVRGSRETDHSAAKGLEKASKSKARPPRPISASTSKHEKQAPSQPVAKSRKKKNEDASSTQVSSVLETYIEPSAIALYDYEPTALDDLSFSAGDEIVLVKKIDDDWYVGRLGNEEGMFPVKFVEIIEDLPQETTQEDQPSAVPASSPFDVMALYDFHGNDQDGKLVFSAGDMVHVIEKINDDWLKGETGGQTGSFPCSFVDISIDVINKLPQTERNVSANKSRKETHSKPGRTLQCKALFDYNSGVAEDLSFSVGDVIEVHEKISDEWIKGKLHGQVGMFPSAFVEMLEGAQEKIGTETEETKKPVVEYGTARYDFTASASDELSFKKGDRIEVTEIVSDDWLRGRLGDHEGMFPQAFVQLSNEPGPQPRKNVKATPKAKALFDFDGEYEDELSFKVDDDIILLERINDEWLKGQVNHRVGRFPAAFVKVLTPLP